ncbi:MAG: hydrogenase iron-sulfur subunit [Chloroflexi bacterium]|nr:MAG: hydrogenase iron-sulfur subunit [Chloroflexota bacterium]
MKKQRKLYLQRKQWRFAEKLWSKLEGTINRVTTSADSLRPYNPLYHLGTLSIYLLIILTITGIYLTIFYRAGSDRAYESVNNISAFWLGSLMRSVHRYAADGLLIIAFLHALKMMLSDRFWGSRWLAWVSGWGMFVISWLIGTMGYWLVWDERAQWLTEYSINLIKGQFAMPFLSPEIASRTFSLFVIVLFLHVFIPITMIVGIIIHVLRLTRVRLWSPRWLMVETGIVLVLLSVWKPVTSALPADFGRVISQVSLDWWYLGFLPLTAQWGNPLFWGIALIVGGIITALPWISPGAHIGPAVVTNPNCTGCALCARECPYNAIEMVSRDDETRFKSLAIINEKLCTACGICVGTCATSGVELAGWHASVLLADLQRALAQARQAGQQPVAIFTCDRHKALGSLDVKWQEEPASDTVIPLLQSPAWQRVQAGVWTGGNPHPVAILSCTVPCAGMLHPDWIRSALNDGAKAALVIACPEDDCAYREGPMWLKGRLARRQRTLPPQVLHYVELAPGSQGEVRRLLKAIGAGKMPEQKPLKLPKKKQVTDWRAVLGQMRYLATGLVVLLVALGISLLAERPSSNPTPQPSLIRIAINHGGKLIAASENLPPEVIAKLPANVDPAQVLGGERFPVRLRLIVDGQQVLEDTYQPRGLRREGAIFGLENWWLTPGTHKVEIWMMDDESEWKQVFADTVTIASQEALILFYDEETNQFILR